MRKPANGSRYFSASQFAGFAFTNSALQWGDLPTGPLDYLAYDAASCLVLFGVGVLVNQRRDA